MILTAQQKQAMIMIEKFIADKDSQVFILKGYAGTGKTTLIRSIADYLSYSIFTYSVNGSDRTCCKNITF